MVVIFRWCINNKAETNRPFPTMSSGNCFRGLKWVVAGEKGRAKKSGDSVRQTNIPTQYTRSKGGGGPSGPGAYSR